jgi:hypothetical protein
MFRTHLAGAYSNRGEAQKEAQVLRDYGYGAWVKTL